MVIIVADIGNIMEYKEGQIRDQVVLFNQTIDELVSQDNAVRFIDEFVDSLDLKVLLFSHTQEKTVGCKSYNPADMLKLYIYGYTNGVRSSRKLEQETYRNVEAMWLLKMLKPDHKTISNFRKNNETGIKNVFKAFVIYCKELNLIGKELLAIDGSKFKALNAKKRNYNKKSINKKLENIDKSIEKYLEELKENDKKSVNQCIPTKNEIKRKINKLKTKKEELKNLEKQLIESDQTQISLTDPDSKLMVCNGKKDVCYNTQIAVDDKYKLIVDVKVVNDTDDHQQLSNMAKNAKELLEVETIEVLADKGYFNRLEIKECLDNGITPYIAKPEDNKYKSGVPASDYSLSRFKYLQENDIYLCPCEKQLKYIRTVNIRGVEYMVYQTPDCTDCKSKHLCTKNKKGRIIYRWKDEKIIDDMQQAIKQNKNKYKKRQAIVEHPFGTIKRPMNQGYMLMKGLKKVNIEMNLTCLAYNIKRVINILGVKNLIEAMKLLLKSFFEFIRQKNWFYFTNFEVYCFLT